MALAFIAVPSEARVLLKPSSGDSLKLRVKSLSANVRIHGQFAETTLLLTFLNESGARMEADFIYELPPGGVATYFAYWAEDEKVVARVVEKERAAEIYEAITTRQRDPALIELTGSNTFRARIFPVMPDADLKVEIRLVQVLRSDAKGVSYALPLVDGESKPEALEKIDIRARVTPGAGVTDVVTNYGIPVERAGDGYSISFFGTSFRPSKDLVIRQVWEPAPLHSSVYAAPSGGRDGFFALALTPDVAVTRPRVSIRGVSTYHVVNAAGGAVRAHEPVAVFGRYRGSGTATVTLTGTSPTGPIRRTADVQLGSGTEPNNLATKLWASERIRLLSNRSEVVALSKRFTMPSKFTSWLAVPKAEMEMYKREKAQAELWNMEANLIELIKRGAYQTAQGRALRARYNRLCKQLDCNPADELKWRAESDIWEIAYKLVEERHSDKPSQAKMALMQRKLARLEKVAGSSAKEAIADAERPYYEDEMYELRARLIDEYRKPKPDSRLIARLNKRFAEVNTILYSRDYALARVERLKLHSDLEKVNRAIEEADNASPPADATALRERQAKLEKQEETFAARMGDPLIYVEAPSDAVRVVALMPDGEAKPLEYNKTAGRWEARFDIPLHAREGDYVVTVIVVLRDGTRKLLTFRYRVDLTPPRGIGSAQSGDGGRVLRLEIDACDDTARVSALLPWGERIDLRRGSKPHRFFGLASVPSGQDAGAVTFVLTDAAHNRTKVTVDANN